MNNHGGNVGVKTPAYLYGLYIAAIVALAVVGAWLAAGAVALVTVVFAVVQLRGSVANAQESLARLDSVFESSDRIPRIGPSRQAS